MKVESVEIGKLQYDPANARKHSTKNLDAIKGSLARFGQQKPIVVGKGNVVIAGNGTLEAAKALGWDKIDVVKTALEGSDATAFALADNRSAELAEWDDEILNATLKALETEGFPIADIGFADFDFAVPPSEGLTDPDAVPEQVETRCKPGDLWVLGNHRLLCGDATNVQHVERLMAGTKAELLFTSPPYSDQREYNGGKELSTEHIATFIRAAFAHVELMAVNLGLSRKGGEVNQYWDDYVKEAKACGLKLLSWNVWDKGECGSIGNQTAMFGISHEWIFVFGTEAKKLNRTVPNKYAGDLSDHNTTRQADGSTKRGKTRKVSDFSQLKTVYQVSAQKARDDIDHPARFPVEFPEGYVLACTAPGGGVYEPFTGSGSTLIACEKTARRCFGMELDPKYCDVILARWEAFTGKTASLENAKVTP